MDFKALVLIIITVVWLYSILLSVIRMQSARNPVPASVSDVYDQDTYLKWRAYNAEKNRFAIVTSTASFVVELAMLAFNVYAAFAGLFPKEDLFLQMFSVFLLSGLSSLLLLPLSWRQF